MAEPSYRGDIATGAKMSGAWPALFMRFPDRFIIGADTSTAERRISYERIIDTYRGWLGDLPEPVASAIRWQNGARMFGVPQVK